VNVEELIVENKIFGSYGRWVYLSEVDACVCVPNKNGSTAFQNKVSRLGAPTNVASVMMTSTTIGDRQHRNPISSESAFLRR